MFGKKKAIEVWFAVNRDGFVGMYMEKPIRNEETGHWDSKFPFVNPQAYQIIEKITEQAKMTWENDPECMPFQFG